MTATLDDIKLLAQEMDVAVQTQVLLDFKTSFIELELEDFIPLDVSEV